MTILCFYPVRLKKSQSLYIFFVSLILIIQNLALCNLYCWFTAVILANAFELVSLLLFSSYKQYSTQRHKTYQVTLLLKSSSSSLFHSESKPKPSQRSTGSPHTCTLNFLSEFSVLPSLITTSPTPALDVLHILQIYPRSKVRTLDVPSTWTEHSSDIHIT
jgi:hypothetical protein